jgi:hypothetical protein
MRPNYYIFILTEMLKYCQIYKDDGDTLNWIEVLELNQHPDRISNINVVDDNNSSNVLAYAVWGWKDRELKFGKAEVKDKSLKKHNIGTVIMKMVIAIAKFYKASLITDSVTGEPFLWDWYPKLGFTIYDQNKLIMEFES